MHDGSERPQESFAGAIVGGSLVALTGLFLGGPLLTAFDLSFDHDPTTAVKAATAIVVWASLAGGSWSGARAYRDGGAGPVMVGLGVWGATALVTVQLAMQGFDLPDWGVLEGADADILMPFIRFAAWHRVLALAVSIVACLLGAWIGAHQRRPAVWNNIKTWRRQTPARVDAVDRLQA